jgi:glycosyltransferase involved in cell wall biosynthesis
VPILYSTDIVLLAETSLAESTEQNSLQIIHLVSSISTSIGGKGRAALASAYALAQTGTKVHILAYEDGPVDWPWGNSPPPNLEVSLFPVARSKAFASSGLLTRLGELYAISGSVLHLHGLWEPLLASAAKLARKQNVPYVCSIHGMFDPWCVRQKSLKKRGYYWLVERRRLARAAALHFTAQREEEKAGPWIPRGPQRLIIPILMDLSPFETLGNPDRAHAFFPGVPPDAPWILFLSRIHEKKGLDLLIDAVSLLADKRVQLIIAGQGEEAYVRALKQRAQDARITERVHFVGLVQGAQKYALLRRANMLAIPSSQENFGIVFPEALASGTPVLLTEEVDIHRELVDSQGALLTRRDPADIAEKISTLLADPAAARARGEAGRRWVFSNLSPHAISLRWLQVYGAIVGLPAGADARPAPAREY